MKTATVKKEWFIWLCDHCEASSGKNGNLVGMRKKFWGDAPVIRCCGYLFKVTREDFARVVFGR